MSSGKLKASTNRVRTSIALQGNSMWTNTIGQQAETGTNSAIEAAINAPSHGPGRTARRAAAAEAVKQAGGFNSAVDNYESLLNLARSQGAVGASNRGACKKCGQLGHLTKQCRNDQSIFFAGTNAAAAAQASAAGVGLEKPPGPPEKNGDLSSDFSDISSSDLDSDSSSTDSDNSEEERRKAKKRKHKHKSSGKVKWCTVVIEILAHNEAR
ncbi:hypothetical protein WJX73_007989 [Symbiochloris irregularis]|uniref:CCHC-type domain-containing protein n=1 Tax=Symbiochloris irregularis TaxID=706552 RepID=A0AAW1Q4I5_9CHLO